MNIDVYPVNAILSIEAHIYLLIKIIVWLYFLGKKLITQTIDITSTRSLIYKQVHTNYINYSVSSNRAKVSITQKNKK